jgi:hypothetical protein
MGFFLCADGYTDTSLTCRGHIMAYARIISVAHLPSYTPEVVCLTAVRMQTQDGELALLYDNSPVAATLNSGNWVEYESTAKEWGAFVRPLKVVNHVLAGASSVDGVTDALHVMGKSLEATVRAREDGALNFTCEKLIDKTHSFSERIYERLLQLREDFDLPVNNRQLPVEILMSALPDPLRELNRLYVRFVKNALKA